MLRISLVVLMSLHLACTRSVPEQTPQRESIYQLESQWVDQFGKNRRLNSLKGRPQVVAMIYTSCEHVCPMIVSDMLRIRKQLPRKLQKKIGMVAVTIDPGKDSPTVLKSFARKRGLDSSWVLLNGGTDNTLELAAVLGVKYKSGPGGHFSHSNIIHILDATGALRHQQVGLNVDPAESVQMLTRLLR